MAAVTLAPNSLSNEVVIRAGQHTTVAAVDTLDMAPYGISTIVSAVANWATDPADDNVFVSTSFSGATLTIKTWKGASASDYTPTAASAFSKVVNYIVVGY